MEIVEVEKRFKNFIIENNHPCIMAQSIFKQQNFNLKLYGNFGSKHTAYKIIADIGDYLKNYNGSKNDFYTFIAAFDSREGINELTFEILLWRQLQEISELDNKPWDNSVSQDPQDDEFSFSILGKAFYIVGMHPNSSRKARQSPLPCMVFNLHSQFETLRNMNTYSQVRNRIRKRDKELNGSVNPMLADFGHKSEAKQYSGRAVGEEWKCPFSKNQPT